MFKKARGQEAKLSYLGHLLTENRHGLAVNTRLTLATGTAEREAALAMAEEIPGVHRVTLGADKNYDTQDFVDGGHLQSAANAKPAGSYGMKCEQAIRRGPKYLPKRWTDNYGPLQKRVEKMVPPNAVLLF